MPVSIGPRIGVQGADEFRQAFRLMAQDAKKFKTELDEVKASFTANDSAMDRSKAVTEQLTKQLEQNTRVLQAATDTREKAKEAVDKAADAYEAEKAKLKEIPELVKKNAERVAVLTEKYEQQKKWTDELKDSQNKAKKSYEDITQKVDTQKTRIAYLKEEYDKHREALRKMREEQGRNSDEVKKASAALKDEKEQLNNAKKELAGLKEEQKEAKGNLSTINKLVKDNTSELNANEKELQKAIKANKDENTLVEEQEKKIHNASTRLYEAQNVLSQYDEKLIETKTDTAELNKQIEETPGKLDIMSGRLTDLGETVGNIGTALSTYITAPLVALGTYGVKNASNLTDGMAKIYTIATETQEPMAEMRQGLIDLSDATGFALDDLTEAAYQAVSASVDAGDAVAFMGDATKLARAGFTTTERSVDLLTTIMNAYGKETYDAAYLSDLLLRTQNDGKTIVDQLAASMGTVIPTAAAYNVGIEQVAAAYATMTKQGVNTARATTMLNALFTELEKPDKDAAKTIAALNDGKTFAQLMKEGKSLGDVLGMLYNNLDKDSEAFANLFVNVRSARAANALMADDSKILNYELERMSDVTGQTDYALQMLETPSLKARRALNKLKNSTIDLGDTIISDLYPVFEKMVDIVDDFRGWVKGLSTEQKKSIARWGALIAAIGPALKIFGGLTSSVGGALDLFVKMKKATTGVTSAGKALSAIINTEGLGFGALASGAGYALAGVVGVTAAIAALGFAIKVNNDNFLKQYEAEYGLTEQDKKLIESTNTLHQSRLDMKNATDQEIVSISQNTTLAEQLVKKYNDLVDSTGLATQSSQTLADMYLDQLAEALGLEREQVEELIDANGRLSTSIDDVIQKRRAEAMLEAYRDDYLDAIEKQAEAEKQVADLTGRYAQKQLEVNQLLADATHWEREATREQEKFGYTTDATAEKARNSNLALETAQDALGELGKSLGIAEEDLVSYNTTIANYEGLNASVLSGSVYQMQASLQELVDGFIHAEDGTRESLENQVKNAKENLDKIQKAFANGTDGVTQDTLDAYRQIYTDSQAELNKWVQMNGEQATKGMNTFDDNIRNKKEQTRKATQDATSVIPAETGKQLKAAVNTADTGMEGVISRLRSKVVSMTNAGKDLVGAIKAVFKDNKYYNEMFSAGSYFVQGFINGMKAVNVSRPSNQIMTTAVQASKSRLMEKSPSKVMEEVGEFFTLGFVQGINNENAAVRRSANAMSQSAVDSSWMTANYTPTGYGYASQGMASTRNITAPISVNVTVNGNVDDYDALAEVIADRINDQIIRRDEVFA